MPQKNKRVIFKFGTQAQFEAMEVKDPNTFYILTDTHEIYIGNNNYSASINISDLDTEQLAANKILIKPEIEQYETLQGYVPQFNNNGQLISSGHILNKDVPSDAQLTDTTYLPATNIADGLMSQEDKQFLDSLKNKNASYENSEYVSGFMLGEDKEKLDGIASGAQVNQNTFSNITINNTTISADSKTDTLTLIAGNNITLTPDDTNDTVTITATDTNTTYEAAAASVSGVGGTDGLLTAADKEKLNKIEICDSTTYNNMTERNAILYFILDEDENQNKTLIIKDNANNIINLLTNGGT